MEYYLLHEMSQIDRKVIEKEKNQNLKKSGIIIMRLKQKIKLLKEEYNLLNEKLKLNKKVANEYSIKTTKTNDDIKKCEDLLYSTSNLKTIEICQKKIELLNSELKICEQNEFEILSDNEKNEKRVVEIVEKANEIKEPYNEEMNIYKKESFMKKQEIDELLKRRKEIEVKVNEKILNEYNIIKSKYGYGVCEIEEELCNGCNLSLPIIIITQAKKHKELVKCPNCGRYLYIE